MIIQYKKWEEGGCQKKGGYREGGHEPGLFSILFYNNTSHDFLLFKPYLSLKIRININSFDFGNYDVVVVLSRM